MTDRDLPAGGPVVGVLALQGGVIEHERVLDELGVAHRKVRLPEHLEGLSALILPGGESTTMSKLMRFNGLLELLSDALRAGLPAFGTCAGMILLASTVLDTRDDAVQLGALDATVRRNAFGRQVDSFETDLDFAGIDGPVPATFIRAPWVESVGDGVEVLATLHGRDASDLAGRAVYKPILVSKLFQNLVILRKDQSFRIERMVE